MERIHYTKLPGRRRGFLFGSSVWLGPDHLLLVKSSRFREQYRRFYYRDIQGIVWADAPRFHLSTRSAILGLVCLLAIGLTSGAATLATAQSVLTALLVGLVVVWFCLCMFQSCRCRIYTAVSSEELPSVYRVWTARRFVRKVEPHITAAQGTIEEGLAEVLEQRDVGPLPEGRVGLDQAPGGEPRPTMEMRAARTPITMSFVGSLCAGGAAAIATLGTRATIARWVVLAAVLIQLATAVAVIVQNFKSRLSPALRNLAIGSAVAIGVWFYAVQTGASIAIAYRDGKKAPMFPKEAEALALLEYPAARASAGAIGLLAGIAGLILLARGDRAPDERVSFNV